jgi:hypothetical protein
LTPAFASISHNTSATFFDIRTFLNSSVDPESATRAIHSRRLGRE